MVGFQIAAELAEFQNGFFVRPVEDVHPVSNPKNASAMGSAHTMDIEWACTRFYRLKETMQISRGGACFFIKQDFHQHQSIFPAERSLVVAGGNGNDGFDIPFAKGINDFVIIEFAAAH